MNEEELGMGRGNGKKRGRKPKDQKKTYELNREQTKFFVDVSENKNESEVIFNYLLKANQKDYGRELNFKDLALYALAKLTDKDIDKLKEGSLSEMEKVQRALDLYNEKNGSVLNLGEFLTMKLGIN